MFEKPFIMVVTRESALASPDGPEIAQRFKESLRADPDATHVVVLSTDAGSKYAFPRGPAEAALMIDQAARALAPQTVPVVADAEVMAPIQAAAEMLNREAAGEPKH